MTSATDQLGPWIEVVVIDFYQRATVDILIGYHFREILEKNELEAHLPRIIDFWRLHFGLNAIDPVNKAFNILNLHRELKIKKGEVGRWVIIFQETLKDFSQGQAEKKQFSELWQKKIRHFQKTFEEKLF